MPIERFQVAQTKGLDMVECDDVPQLMVVAGPNGVGKSTLLNELYVENQSQLDPHSFTRSGNVDIEYANGNKCVYFSPNRVPQSRSITRSQLVDSGYNQYSEMMSDETLEINGIAQREDILISADTKPYQAVRRRMAELREVRRDLLDREYTPETGVDPEAVPEPAEYLQDAIKNVLPGIRYQGVDTGTDDSYHERTTVELVFHNRSGDQVTFADLSSGEKDVVAMIFLLIEPKIQQRYVDAGIDEPANEDVTVLIDSPEMHLHPDLEKRFINFISDYIEAERTDHSGTKFIIATHSKIMMESVNKDDLYYLLYPSMVAGNQLEPATEIDTDSLQEITDELGLAALSSGRHLLCVEGKTDDQILSHLYPEILEEFTILPMGGSNQVKNIDKSLSNLMNEITSSGREIFAVIDQDRNPSLEDDVQNRVHVLSGTCIENLLLSPKAIHSVSQTLLDEETREEMGVNSLEGIQSLIHDTISEPRFKREEVWTRFNERFNPINVDRGEYYYKREEGIVQDFEEYLDNQINEHRESVDRIEEIESEVESLVENDNWAKLDGKRTLKSLSNKFNVETRRFTRLIAREMYQIAREDTIDYERPSELTDFFTDMRESTR